jgi:K+-transporting ATPase KdpF subunit
MKATLYFNFSSGLTVITNHPVAMNNLIWLAIGAVVAFILFIYLIAVLLKPEKF